MTGRPVVPASRALPVPAERRRLRESSALTREEVAAVLGVRPESVRSWECGRSKPRGKDRKRYARLLDEMAAARTPRRGVPTAAALPGAVGREPEPEHVREPEPERETGPEPVRSPDPEPGREPEPEPDHAHEPEPVRRPGPESLTPEKAFELLYAHAAPDLVRQTYLLTGERAPAAAAVERAFHTAWERWPEVARDPDPAGWVRAAAYEHALSPWPRLRLLRGRRERRERGERGGADTAPALLGAVTGLPPSYRRTLLLHDLVGLGLSETAAETEASTPATASRLVRARREVAARLPELADPAELRARLAELPLPKGLVPADPLAGRTVRARGEGRTRFRTRAAFGLTAVVVGATGFTLVTTGPYGPPPGPDTRIAEGGEGPRDGRPGPERPSEAEPASRERADAGGTR